MTMTGIFSRSFASWVVPMEGVSPPRKRAEHNSTRWAPPFSDSMASSMDPQQISSRIWGMGRNLTESRGLRESSRNRGVSEVFWGEASVFCDSRQDFRSQFIAIAKGPNIHWVECRFMLELYVGTALRDNLPANFKKSLEDMLRLHAWPLAQAEAQSSVIERGTFFEFGFNIPMHVVSPDAGGRFLVGRHTHRMP